MRNFRKLTSWFSFRTKAVSYFSQTHQVLQQSNSKWTETRSLSEISENPHHGFHLQQNPSHILSSSYFSQTHQLQHSRSKSTKTRLISESRKPHAGFPLWSKHTDLQIRHQPKTEFILKINKQTKKSDKEKAWERN